MTFVSSHPPAFIFWNSFRNFDFNLICLCRVIWQMFLWIYFSFWVSVSDSWSDSSNFLCTCYQWAYSTCLQSGCIMSSKIRSPMSILIIIWNACLGILSFLNIQTKLFVESVSDVYTLFVRILMNIHIHILRYQHSHHGDSGLRRDNREN